MLINLDGFIVCYANQLCVCIETHKMQFVTKQSHAGRREKILIWMLERVCKVANEMNSHILHVLLAKLFLKTLNSFHETTEMCTVMSRDKNLTGVTHDEFKLRAKSFSHPGCHRDRFFFALDTQTESRVHFIICHRKFVEAAKKTTRLIASMHVNDDEMCKKRSRRKTSSFNNFFAAHLLWFIFFRKEIRPTHGGLIWGLRGNLLWSRSSSSSPSLAHLAADKILAIRSDFEGDRNQFASIKGFERNFKCFRVDYHKLEGRMILSGCYRVVHRGNNGLTAWSVCEEWDKRLWD